MSYAEGAARLEPVQRMADDDASWFDWWREEEPEVPRSEEPSPEQPPETSVLPPPAEKKEEAKKEPPKGTWLGPIPGYKPAVPTIKTVAQANSILARGLPVGTVVDFEIDGILYKARAEWHKHPATDKVAAGLKEWHRGITVYEPSAKKKQ